MHNTRFDSEKAVEAILYVASHAPNPDLYHVGKILYYADRIHLERYGRLITSDRYVAMKNGPVASGTYDLLKTARGDNGQHCPAGCTKEAVQASISVLGKKQNYRVLANRAHDIEFFSRSDLKCLDEAIATYGHFTFDQLNEISHDEIWRSVHLNSEIPLENIARHCNHSEQLLEYLHG
ncbi:Panacea domain-containing protein [Serratia fonticola]